MNAAAEAQILELAGAEFKPYDLLLPGEAEVLERWRPCHPLPESHAYHGWEIRHAPSIFQPLHIRGSCQILRPTEQSKSYLESLPYEIHYEILEKTDMASVLSFAAASSFLRERVAATPLIARISNSRELTAYFLAFRTTDTQNVFSPQDLETAIQSIHYAYYRETSRFRFSTQSPSLQDCLPHLCK